MEKSFEKKKKNRVSWSSPCYFCVFGIDRYSGGIYPIDGL